MKDKGEGYLGTMWEIRRNDMPWGYNYVATIRTKGKLYSNTLHSAIARAFIAYNFNGELSRADWTLFRCDYEARPPKHVYNEAYHHLPDEKSPKEVEDIIKMTLEHRENRHLYKDLF